MYLLFKTNLSSPPSPNNWVLFSTSSKRASVGSEPASPLGAALGLLREPRAGLAATRLPFCWPVCMSFLPRAGWAHQVSLSSEKQRTNSLKPEWLRSSPLPRVLTLWTEGTKEEDGSLGKRIERASRRPDLEPRLCAFACPLSNHMCIYFLTQNIIHNLMRSFRLASFGGYEILVGIQFKWQVLCLPRLKAKWRERLENQRIDGKL